LTSFEGKGKERKDFFSVPEGGAFRAENMGRREETSSLFSLTFIIGGGGKGGGWLPRLNSHIPEIARSFFSSGLRGKMERGREGCCKFKEGKGQRLGPLLDSIKGEKKYSPQVGKREGRLRTEPTFST